jgi:predicted nucleic acid-binding Zn ribbon protein
MFYLWDFFARAAGLDTMMSDEGCRGAINAMGIIFEYSPRYRTDDRPAGGSTRETSWAGG